MILSFLIQIGAPGAAAQPARPEARAPKALRAMDGSDIVCLTFDDGYNRKSITNILDCLLGHDIRCTFFIIGECLEKYPELWQRAVDEGHEIAYHTMRHDYLTSMKDEQILDDIEKWNEAARNVLGRDYDIPKIARFPGGAGFQSDRVMALFTGLGYTVVGWSIDSSYLLESAREDKAQAAADHIVHRLEAGKIVLQHFKYYDAEALELYLDRVSGQYSFATVSQALHELNISVPAANPENSSLLQ